MDLITILHPKETNLVDPAVPDGRPRKNKAVPHRFVAAGTATAESGIRYIEGQVTREFYPDDVFPGKTLFLVKKPKRSAAEKGDTLIWLIFFDLPWLVDGDSPQKFLLKVFGRDGAGHKVAAAEVPGFHVRRGRSGGTGGPQSMSVTFDYPAPDQVIEGAEREDFFAYGYGTDYLLSADIYDVTVSESPVFFATDEYHHFEPTESFWVAHFYPFENEAPFLARLIVTDVSNQGEEVNFQIEDD